MCFAKQEWPIQASLNLERSSKDGMFALPISYGPEMFGLLHFTVLKPCATPDRIPGVML